jgi:hypothetical protein
VLLQPETRSITQEQLVDEVKEVYAGLVMVEEKCAEIDQQQASTTNKLSNERWNALINLHRTLLHQYHDFFLASQPPSSSPALRRLATKYAMPARMWKHCNFSADGGDNSLFLLAFDNFSVDSSVAVLPSLAKSTTLRDVIVWRIQGISSLGHAGSSATFDGGQRRRCKWKVLQHKETWGGRVSNAHE